MRETHGYAKQGVGYGYNKVKGLNALLARRVHPDDGADHRRAPAPQGCGQLRPGRREVPVRRDRRDPPGRRGHAHLLPPGLRVLQPLRGGRDPRWEGPVLDHRPDGQSGDESDQPDPARTGGCPSSTRTRSSTRNSSGGSPTPRSPRSTYTAFTSKPKAHQVTARLIVRRVKRLNPDTAPAGQDELFSVYRHHAVFTNSLEPMLTAEAHHRDHAIVEQVIADLKSSALQHFPSGRYQRQRGLAGVRGDRLQPGPRRRCPRRRETHAKPAPARSEPS